MMATGRALGACGGGGYNEEPAACEELSDTAVTEADEGEFEK